MDYHWKSMPSIKNIIVDLTFLYNQKWTIIFTKYFPPISHTIQGRRTGQNQNIIASLELSSHFHGISPVKNDLIWEVWPFGIFQD